MSDDAFIHTTIDRLIKNPEMSNESAKSWKNYLVGIDTAEIHGEFRNLGNKAEARVRDLLPIDNETTLITDGEEGKFERILGDVISVKVAPVLKKSVTGILLEERLAVAYTGQNRDDIQAEHQINYDYHPLWMQLAAVTLHFDVDRRAYGKTIERCKDSRSVRYKKRGLCSKVA